MINAVIINISAAGINFCGGFVLFNGVYNFRLQCKLMYVLHVNCKLIYSSELYCKLFLTKIYIMI